MYRKIIDSLRNKKIAILGFGKEGKSTYCFLRKYLDNVLTIIDKKDVKNSFGEEFTDDKVVFVSGKGYLDSLAQYDVVIKTPGISLYGIDLEGVNLTSQLELVLANFEGMSIGITGTKGKSTTTSLIYEIIKEQREKVYLVGNIGTPILDLVEEYDDETTLVIEMSSHQLEFLKTSPRIGIILNLYQDHLDHDKTVERYHANKLNMFRNQKDGDWAIYNWDNDYLKNYMVNNAYLGKKIGISSELKKEVYRVDNKFYYGDTFLYDTEDKRKLIGSYNILNIVFALLVGKILGLDLDKAREVVRNFDQVEYRMMLVGEVKKVKYYSDTLATIPEATISGIEGLGNVNTLIFGGMDRGIDYEGFVDYLNKCEIKHFICMPTTGYTIGKRLVNGEVYFCDTLELAVEKAKEVTEVNTNCLLSPAASSYEQFKNYIEKADKYREYVNRN